jgi:hypothetical protein
MGGAYHLAGSVERRGGTPGDDADRSERVYDEPRRLPDLRPKAEELSRFILNGAVRRLAIR